LQVSFKPQCRVLPGYFYGKWFPVDMHPVKILKHMIGKILLGMLKGNLVFLKSTIFLKKLRDRNKPAFKEILTVNL
jgi:hypothetical protein